MGKIFFRCKTPDEPWATLEEDPRVSGAVCGIVGGGPAGPGTRNTIGRKLKCRSRRQTTATRASLNLVCGFRAIGTMLMAREVGPVWQAYGVM